MDHIFSAYLIPTVNFDDADENGAVLAPHVSPSSICTVIAKTDNFLQTKIDHVSSYGVGRSV